MKANIAPDVQEYNVSMPKAFPVDENGEGSPHRLFMGEIVEEKTK
ncbi:hypothetical protein [Prevotella falsenii]|nr:hypothetical protein [Prevotella falsenii]